MHTPEARSITVAEAGRLWLASCESGRLERATMDGYRQHVELHIVPLLGRLKLAQLGAPEMRQFEDRMLATRSPALARKVITSLGSLLADAMERGLVARNVVRELRSNRRRGKERRAERRQKSKLKIGVDIPSREEIKAIIDAAQGTFRPLILTAIFTGLRASELRGLRWNDIDLNKRELHVRQRADRYNKIGPPKSEAGQRTVPLPDSLLFFASWCINRVEDGGLGLPPKVVQELLGHSSIVMTLDVYGHLFPRGDDRHALDAAERALLA